MVNGKLSLAMLLATGKQAPNSHRHTHARRQTDIGLMVSSAPRNSQAVSAGQINVEPLFSVQLKIYVALRLGRGLHEQAHAGPVTPLGVGY